MADEKSLPQKKIIDAAAEKHPDAAESYRRDANVVLEAMIADFKTADEAVASVAEILKRQGLSFDRQDYSAVVRALHAEAAERRRLRESGRTVE